MHSNGKNPCRISHEHAVIEVWKVRKERHGQHDNTTHEAFYDRVSPHII